MTRIRRRTGGPPLQTADFIVQQVQKLLLSEVSDDNLKGAALFRQHTLAVAPAFSFKLGMFPVWRPFLRDDSTCGTCHGYISAGTEVALWSGKLAHYSCWHMRCWAGQYDVNTRDQAAYKDWLLKQPDPALELRRWHRIVPVIWIAEIDPTLADPVLLE